MTAHSSTTVTINYPAETVHAALTNPEYWAYNVANFSTEPGELHAFDNNQAILYEVMPLDLIPEAVRAMISQNLKIKRVVTWGDLADGTAHGTFTADVKGTPVDYSGDIELSGDDSTTTLTYNNQVTIGIPLMGAAIEPKVAEALSDLLANEANLTSEWIAQQ